MWSEKIITLGIIIIEYTDITVRADNIYMLLISPSV